MKVLSKYLMLLGFLGLISLIITGLIIIISHPDADQAPHWFSVLMASTLSCGIAGALLNAIVNFKKIRNIIKEFINS